MRFYAPHLLWTVLPFVAFLPLVWHLLENRAQAKLARFATPQLMELLLKGGKPQEIRRRRRYRMLLGTLAVALAVVALARPQLGMREEEIKSEGLDVVFLLDVSNSMLAEDIVPNRIKKAKHVIRNFVDRFSGDRAGIVVFAGSAYPASPLTTDYDFLRNTLEGLDETSVGYQGSDLPKALGVAVDLLNNGSPTDEEDSSQENSDDGSKVIVLLSDGESHEGAESKLAPRLREAGIRVYSIGVGSLKGGPIPLRDPSGYMRGYKKDQSGTMILTKLETASLESISSKTGGKYYSASTNEGEVEEIMNELSGMDRVMGAARRVIVYDEFFQYPMGLAILLVLAMLYLRESPAAARRRLAAPVEQGKPSSATVAPLALLLVLLGARDAQAAKSIGEYRSTKKGLESYEDKDYTTAIQEFGKAQASNPDSPEHHLNLGDAMLKSGSPDGAIPEFQAVTKAQNPDLAAKGAYNLGKAYEAQKNFEQAIRAYQSGLTRLGEIQKSDPEAELRIKRALETAQQQKQQQQQDQQGGGGGGEGQQKQDPKDNQGDKKAQEEKKYDIPKKKQQFKGEKMNENDAKRIIKQLQEQEKKTQQKVMRNKTGKPKDDKNNIKDW